MATNQHTTTATTDSTDTETGWPRARGPEDGGQAWCDRHDVNRRLTPFAYRNTDPIEVGQKLSAHLETVRETAATFKPYEAFEDDANPEAEILHYHLELRGSWPIDTAGRPKWVNPNYVHIESFERGTVSDTDERLAILDRMAGSGVAFLDDLAPRFGMTTSRLENVCSEHDVDWQANRRAGRRRTARTCRLAIEWGHSWQAVTDALPRATRTITDWMTKYGELESVPQDPSLGTGGGE